jgi:hypothetical protein
VSGYRSETRLLLEQYLGRIGMSRPHDAALQVQLTLLRQWCEHLADVLEAEQIPFVLGRSIIRQMIYGGVPSLAEQEIRGRLVDEMVTMQARARPRAWDGT